MPATDLNAAIAARHDLSARYMIIRVVTVGWEMPSFIAGQFAVLGLPGSAPRCDQADPDRDEVDPAKLLRRAYSIASSSKTKEYIEFYISLVSSGSLTPRLFALKPGDRLYLSPKISGLFSLDQVPYDRNVVLIATGTGLAPYMSMLSSELRCGGPRHYAVLHGAYHSWDLGYRSELMNLQHLCRNFAYFATIDHPEEEPVPWAGYVGWVQELWKKRLVQKAWGFEPTLEDTHIFLCGAPAMIEDMVGILGNEGYIEYNSARKRGEIHIERY
jgi:ferredoxin--NADP+ reductase